MGSHQHLLSGSFIELRDADPVLRTAWDQVLKSSDQQRARDLGVTSLHRLRHLIRSDGFTPLLDFRSLAEKHYIEAQRFHTEADALKMDSLKEVYVSSTGTEVVPPVIPLFDEEEDQDQYGEGFDGEV